MVMHFMVYSYVMLEKSFLREESVKVYMQSPFIHMPVFVG